MTRFNLQEISAVTRPAQQPAEASIMKNRDDNPLAEKTVHVGDQLLMSGLSKGRDLQAVGYDMAKAEGNELKTSLQRVVDLTKVCMADVVNAMITKGTPKDEAVNRSVETPLGRQLYALSKAAEKTLEANDFTVAKVRGPRNGEGFEQFYRRIVIDEPQLSREVARIMYNEAKQTSVDKLRGLSKRLEAIPFNKVSDAALDALVAAEATAEKIEKGETVSREHIQKVLTQCESVISGKDSNTMTKSNDTPTSPVDVLEKAERDTLGNLVDPAGTLAAMQKAGQPAAASGTLTKKQQAEDKLTELANDMIKAAEAKGETADFYDCYNKVSEANPGLLAEAVG